jgi:hypothetical protein
MTLTEPSNASSTDGETITEGETSSDDFFLTKTITGTVDGSAQVMSNFGSNTSGSCAAGSFSYDYASSTYNSLTEDGNITYDRVTTSFATLNISSLARPARSQAPPR